MSASDMRGCEPRMSLSRSRATQLRFESARRRSIAAPGAINEMDVVALRDRRRKARHQRLVLAVKPVADDASGLRPRKALLDRIGKILRAIENHAQPVIELAEI